MIDFITSLSWVGWLLLALAAFTLWHLPSIVRMALFGDRVSKARPLRHGTDRPDLDIDDNA